MKARLIAVGILLIGLVSTAFLWYKFLTQGAYWGKASVLTPMAVCIGLSMVIYPITKENNLERFGQARIPWRHIPILQKILILLGVVLGFAQVAYFSGAFHI
jgi:hypothetical protein